MRKVVLFLASITAAFSCSREPVELPSPKGGDLFGISIQEGWSSSPDTKSCLSGVSDIESRMTSVCLGIYRGGNLYDTKYLTSGLGAMSLRLDSGSTYMIYALVNMGDVRSLYPSQEMDLEGLVWTLSSLTDSSTGVIARGIPMAGSLEYTAGSGGSTAIPVKRLLAKVTLNIGCTWPGGSISRASICQANGRLLPFGTSAMLSGSDEATACRDYEVDLSGTSQSVVLYVPENIQGTSATPINASYKKSPDWSAWVEANLERFTYLEVEITGTGLYQGSMVYRHLLGSNATSNFDIRRNTAYTWTLRYDEDRLSWNDWKHDSSLLTDTRYLGVTFPIYATLCQHVTLSDYATTNIPLGDIEYCVLDDGGQGIYEYSNDSTLDGESFEVDGHNHYDEYHPIELEIYPVNNSTDPLYNWGYIYLCEGDLSYVNETRVLTGSVYNYPTGSYYSEGSTGAKAYYVLPGGKRNVDLYCRYDYINEDGDDVWEQVTGQWGKSWTCATIPYPGVTASYAGVSSGNDQMLYSVTSTVIPGNYAIQPTNIDWSSVSTRRGYLHVHDSRHLSWTNASSLVPAANEDFIGYQYLCSNKILVFLSSSGTYGSTSGMSFTSANTPFRFLPRDRSTKGKLASGMVPFEGTNSLTATSYLDHINVAYSSSMSTKTSWKLTTTLLGKIRYNGIGFNPKVSTKLTQGKYRITVTCKNAYDAATRHAIEAVICVGAASPWRELFLDPCDSKVTAGASISYQPKMFGCRVSEDVLSQAATSNVSRTACTWSVYPSDGWSGSNGSYTFTKPGNYRITCTYSTYSLTAYADVEVTNNDIDLTSDWDEEDPTILD